MSAATSKIHALTTRLTQPNAQKQRSEEEDLDEEDLFAELEAEIENDSSYAVREQGIGQLQIELERLKHMRQTGHGQYAEITDEKQVVRLSASEPRCVIHFFHTNFRRCEIMDKHLAAIAPKYFDTLFIRVFVENVPWLVEKLGIKVLPCLMCFIDGVSKDRIIGFEDLGNEDSFSTATLEWRLLNNGVIQKTQKPGQVTYNTNGTVRQEIRGRGNDDDDEVFDLDD